MAPLTVQVEDLEDRSTKSYAFLKSPVRLGRGELNDLHLDKPYVSTWHGVIQFDDEDIKFVDLGSTNGTLVDGVRLTKNSPVLIQDSSDLRIGALRIILKRAQTGSVVAARRPPTEFEMRAVGMGDMTFPSAIPPPPLSPQKGTPAVLPPQVAQSSSVVPRPSLMQPAVPFAPPPPAAVPPPPASGPDRAGDAVALAEWQLGVLHEALKQAKEQYDLAVNNAMIGLDETERQRASGLIAQKFPALGGAPVQMAAPPPPPAVPPLLAAFAETYVPGLVLENTPAVQAFLTGVAELMETAVKSFIELRRGYDEFGREMGIRIARGEGAVSSLKEPRKLLAYLLEPSGTSPRAAELGSAFADLMIHQVALLNGVTEGAKDMLGRLSPESITSELEKDGGGGFLKTFREGAQWRKFIERYTELAEEEGALSSALFGKAFARGYSAVAGKRVSAQDETPPPGDDED